MPVSPGTRLGPYEILDAIGAGGMGEVYRARDTRLERAVAIKILPAHLSSDPVRKQRFEREAKIISSLNHPHICVLHDVGQQDGINYLVMECVEGETLAKRLQKGALPVDQVLKFGTQIADALDKAHRSGVVHRDLKPGNIMLTATGVKLLDFGLAKPNASLASLATLTAEAPRQAAVTQEGMIVGTFQYMSPEQIEGKGVDGRSDIFSLGAVLYEMVTGQRAFPGKGQLSVASAILEKEPEPISALKPMTPPTLDHAIRRCLAKDAEERWQTARDLMLELKWIAEPGSQAGVPAPGVSQRKMRERLAWGTATALLTLTTIAFAIGFLRRGAKVPRPMRLTAEIGADAALTTSYGPAAILSPDGTRLAFLARGSDQVDRIYARLLDQLQAIALSGTEHAESPFFSPDGQWIAFFADGKLKKIAVQGGAAVTLCDVSGAGRGGSWSENGTIIFVSGTRVGLFKVSSGGGTPQPLTTLDRQAEEITHRWPHVLPGGEVVLFTAGRTPGGNYEDSDIVAYSMASGQRKTVYHGGFYPAYLPSGHLVFMHEGTLFAVPFDVKRLEVTGQATPILEEVLANTIGGAQFSFSETGNLVYVAGAGAYRNVSIYWMDHDGKFQPLREASANYFLPAFSPDGKRLAVVIRDQSRSDIWVYDLVRDTLTRLTFTGQNNEYPVWTPDGQRITYAVREKSGMQFNIYWKRADGSGDAQRLTESKRDQKPDSWGPDGKVLAFSQISPDTGSDIFTLSFEGDDKSGWNVGSPKPFLNSPSWEAYSSISPDGRWLAYMSNESGNDEVYVRLFPGPGGKEQVSTGVGVVPKWSHNGKELFYSTEDNKIMVVGYTTSADSFRADKPHLWSSGQFTLRGTGYNFDLHPDGKRFAVLKAPGTENPPVINKVNLILNFFEELRRKVPAGKN
jgi:eukaryotic-like serine/threonine-protein kinase